MVGGAVDRRKQWSGLLGDLPNSLAEVFAVDDEPIRFQTRFGPRITRYTVDRATPNSSTRSALVCRPSRHGPACHR